MLGLVFTELTRFIERHHSEEAVDRVLEAAAFEHDGAWTSVGNYPHEEALTLVVTAAEVLGADPDQMVVQFGRELFGRFKELYPAFFSDVATALDFLERVEDHIHSEVRKLYSEARTPRIATAREKLPQGEAMAVEYDSHRPMALLAHGLIEGCIAEFGADLVVDRIDVEGSGGRSARFRVRPVTA
ncbi:MAG: heme NO-binding domain-containing protein [Pseudomonadales bacterium]|nr:heme NO-binding domain-containing protein [Pseudomonadales bacterium]